MVGDAYGFAQYKDLNDYGSTLITHDLLGSQIFSEEEKST